MGQAFEFDPRKAVGNRRKHGVSFSEAMTVFDDPMSSTLPDDSHSYDEKPLHYRRQIDAPAHPLRRLH